MVLNDRFDPIYVVCFHLHYILSGLSSLDGGIAVNTNKFTVDAATGNTAIAGTLGVAGKPNNVSVVVDVA